MRLGAIVVAVLLLPAAWADDKPEKPKDKPLTPTEAAQKVGEKVPVEMEVKSARKGSGVAFLNSEADFKDEKNFTLFINKAGVEKFKEAKVEDLAGHFKGKTVRATGKVALSRERPQIVIEDPAQIVIVKKG
jgi:DNA/RNA endonuclease YhcR with UshA esterase domain